MFNNIKYDVISSTRVDIKVVYKPDWESDASGHPCFILELDKIWYSIDDCLKQ